MMEENDGSSPDGAIGAFLDSCYKGDQAAIASLLEKGVDVNGSDAVYTTPLQVAAASGHETLVQLLMARGAQLEAANLYGWTPLMHAARHGHAGVVRLLLQRGADGRRCNRLGASPLLLAAVSGHLSTVSALLEAGAADAPPASPNPQPRTDRGAQPGKERVAAQPGKGRAVAQPGKEKAIKQHSKERVTAQLSTEKIPAQPIKERAMTQPGKGRATAQISKERATAQVGKDRATAQPSKERAVAQPGKERPAAEKPAWTPRRCPTASLAATSAATLAAAAHGNNSVLRLLLDRGAALDVQLPELGLNALMLAAVGGHRSTCRILLEAGADPNAHNTLGMTALDMARVAGHRQVVRVLEDSTEEAEDTGDSTDLHEAVRRRDLTLATQLLSADPGAANRVRSESGAPLTLAALAGDTPMAALLLRHGAVVDQPEPTTGWTPLMHAVFHNHPEMVKLLLSSGADANVRDHKGCTAFDLASLVDSSPDMIRLLAACTYKFTPPVPPAGLAGGPAPLAWQSRAVSTPSLQDRGLKAWWSRFSSRFQNVRARVEPVVMTGARPLPEETGVPQDADRSRPRLTLDGVLPAAKRLKARTPQGFPARSLPSDTLRPVLPPFCADRSALDRCRLPPALCEGPADCDNGPDSAAVPAASAGSGPAPGGGHLNTYRLLSYLRSPNSSPSNSLGQRRLLSPGPHSSGDSGFETSGKSSIDHPSYLRKAAKGSPAKRGSLKQKPSLRKKPTTTAADPPSAAEPATSDGQAVGKLTYLLRSLGLARYGSAFAAEEIDFEAFLDLTDDDLVELNVSRRDRQKLAVVIQELRQKLRV
ncbi:ankyrin repeat and SAM domain-containing protein 6-like [Amphibalanus amphitrite]|uniref:ankyrin repeat and SAM domain-containing protein 6-like n=1 Tax=Amphibalanus amphitrite TaxID=1232801 RepID=UPI001C904378|nr:ankyrin repeat and SAM domain-containing protein 6-like [Amphibalanus amphitrite]XP_043224290.1 ankyrin repeat and SAM domain-containing protein 6-like [Amphibalanus amphitrite]XP_043224291.1 ankyrin repeat and SAM domain-containing protein 6-like [Amphibalanus amphitrite]